MTTADVEVLGTKLDALKESIDLWHLTNCAENRNSIKAAEDAIVTLRLANASSRKMMLASFFGALIPCVGLIVAMLRIMGKG
jgi:hypothetical protein